MTTDTFATLYGSRILAQLRAEIASQDFSPDASTLILQQGDLS